MHSVHRAALRIFAAVVALTSVSCSKSDAQTPNTERDAGPPSLGVAVDCADSGPVPTFEDLQAGILPICLKCHSASVTGDARNGAPDGLNFDTYEVFKAVSDTAAFLVKEHIMPYPDGGGPTEEQRNQLYVWAGCGTPP